MMNMSGSIKETKTPISKGAKTPLIRVDISVLDWSARSMAVGVVLGETLAKCAIGNIAVNNRENYDGRANTPSENRLGVATTAFETRLLELMNFYFTCSEYLGNVWEYMSSLDQELAEQLMRDYAYSNQDFLNGVIGSE